MKARHRSGTGGAMTHRVSHTLALFHPDHVGMTFRRRHQVASACEHADAAFDLLRLLASSLSFFGDNHCVLLCYLLTGVRWANLIELIICKK